MIPASNVVAFRPTLAPLPRVEEQGSEAQSPARDDAPDGLLYRIACDACMLLALGVILLKGRGAFAFRPL